MNNLITKSAILLMLTAAFALPATADEMHKDHANQADHMNQMDGKAAADLGSMQEGQNSEDQKELNERIESASQVYTKLIENTGVPGKLLNSSDCVAVIPDVRNTALVIGSQSGQGIVSCRTGSGWGTPAFVKLSKKSVGVQAGTAKKNIVLFVVGEEEAENFVTGETKLGTDLSVNVGPVGKSLEADFEIKSGVYSYATEANGLFAGLALNGGSIRLDKEANQQYYSKDFTAEELMETPKMLTSEGQSFVNTLPQTMS